MFDVYVLRVLTLRQVRERERQETKEKEGRRKLRERRKEQREKNKKKRQKNKRIIEQFGAMWAGVPISLI